MKTVLATKVPNATKAEFVKVCRNEYFNTGHVLRKFIERYVADKVFRSEFMGHWENQCYKTMIQESEEDLRNGNVDQIITWEDFLKELNIQV